ncbi:GGDEF domain-containing protein [Paenibacillus psychroresistens]|nr:GGDEF domain-containing protein [Paenibacillus psychroresistens]
MKYTGRIAIVSIAIIIIFVIRIYGHFNYDVPIYQFPFFGLVIILVFWLLGKQYDHVKFLSEKDVLTKLHNRRYMIQTFPKLIAAADRNREKLILYFIDVDDFKHINDNYGHEIGDQVLQRIANVIKFHSRKRDMLVRWAGDEFLTFSAFSDDESKENMINKINNELETTFQDLRITVSVTIGLAVYPDEAITLDDLIHVADQNMYSYKALRHKTNPGL